MKQTLPTILLVLAPFAFAQSKGHTFTGEIMDKQCAQMGSHENMMKGEGAKNARECALACAKNGDKLVLFDSDAKKVYVIEVDNKVRQYAGQRVQVTGTYDDSTETLQVKTVAPAR
jgi:Protein of unknown function (DUF5818)